MLILNAAGVVEYDESLGLRTAHALSKAIVAEQVVGSIVMFGVIYTLLFAVWIFVLNDKIQKGPEPVKGTPSGRDDASGFFSVAARRPAHSDSLTSAETGQSVRDPTQGE